MKNDMLASVPGILTALAGLLGTEIKNRRLEIPPKFGKGYCRGFVFNRHIRMLVSNYELKEDIVIKNPQVNIPGRMIFFKFQNIFPATEQSPTEKHPVQTPSVLIATSRLNTDDFISIHSNTATINIEVDADYLNEQFDLPGKSPVLQSLLQNTQPLLFEQLIYPSLQKIVDDIRTESVSETFELFYLRIKAEDLVCRLLMELETRSETHLYALNNSDVETIYKVKEQILSDLQTPPSINQLAKYASMSPTKLKRIFKQVFGNSIFRYYQEFRMKEAVRLLQENRLSVSEVGYELGFTNLSHFSKVFEEHVGMKPKKYSSSYSSMAHSKKRKKDV
ncbi:helix-turn-helix transcriptional regulator [Chitinophaga filiformis]|uniref:AraC family transcriptional regulator n=1 Tax=Chitinophaga filiformis TaxID=104663 RepID=A0ABY4HY49_CHIFI|nr:AraC family transcriptional regulator [Chitinophaga filiformis]UPK68353.1 AraC family transcriptional regulator [Chitinophaga filiformis]